MELHRSLSQEVPARYRRALERIRTALILALLPLPAYAQEDPISRLLNKAVDLLTNQWAVASAVITIAAIGYRMKYGLPSIRFVPAPQVNNKKWESSGQTAR